jgi:D-3-phosphoglycerate dehydrogenase
MEFRVIDHADQCRQETTVAFRRPCVSFVDCSPQFERVIATHRELLFPDLVVHYGRPDQAETMRRLAAATVAVVDQARLDREALKRSSGLRSIIFLGTGAADYIDIGAARDLAIRVEAVTRYGDRSVAEHAFALMLSAARRIAPMHYALRAERAWHPMEGVELRGKTLAVIGLGGVGREMVRMAAAFGLNVVSWNRSAVDERLPCRFCPLIDDALAQADIVSLHLALTDETRGLLDATRLAQMKPGSILVNTARGALIDEAALIKALEAGALAHAALDVFEEEPLAVNHRFHSLSNVTLTPHAGFLTVEATERLLRLGLAAARRELDRLL